jgi:iron complex outermembrane receptor protein
MPSAEALETGYRTSVSGSPLRTPSAGCFYDYQAAYTRYGISAEYALSKKLALYVNWDDVFAKDRLVYRRAADTLAFAQAYQRYVTPSYIVIGVKASF